MTKRYNEYKDSGIEWIGEVPEHWSLSKIKTVSKIEKGKKIDSLDYEEYGYKKLLSMAYLRGKEEPEFVPYDKVKFAKDGECLILWDGANAGEIIKAKEGVLSSTVALFKMRKNINNNYFYYMLTVNEDSLRKLYTGMGIPHVSGDVLKNTQIFLPKRKEQKAIADYLDNKTSKIDSAVAELTKQKDLLIELKKSTIHQAVTKGLDSTVEMKDSGVEWIGEAPESWRLFRLKDKIKIQTGNSLNQEKKENYSNLDVDGLEYIGSKNIDLLSSKVKNIEFLVPDVDCANFRKAKAGSTLLCIEGGSAGRKITRVNKEYSFVNKLANFYSYALNNDYVYYYLQSSLFKSQFNRDMSGMIGGVSISNLKTMISTFPSKIEQNEIVAYLDKKIGQIDQSIEVIDNQIAKMNEYKKTLINDVVTGKRKVI